MHRCGRLNTFILIFLCLSALYGCNSDVFIDDFSPSATEIFLKGDGDSTTISFSHSNWEIFGATVESGQLLPDRSQRRMSYNDRLTDFTVERYEDDRLKIKVGENIRQTPFVVSMDVGNRYEDRIITITISPATTYQFEKIEYSSVKLRQWTYTIQTDSLTVNNSGGSTVVTHWHPYDGISRTISFSSEDPAAFEILGINSVQVRLPYLKDSTLVVDEKSDEAMFPDQTSVALNFPDVVKDISIAPESSRCIHHLVEYQYFETEFTLYVKNPVSGKERKVQGIFSSSAPTGYLFYLTKTGSL